MVYRGWNSERTAFPRQRDRSGLLALSPIQSMPVLAALMRVHTSFASRAYHTFADVLAMEFFVGFAANNSEKFYDVLGEFMLSTRTVLRHIFPVISPVNSLLISCYGFGPKSTFSSDRFDQNDSKSKSPVNFPVNGNFLQRRVRPRLHPPPDSPR
jgi:hypothetical protein